jgi:hypothetical protein
MLSLNHKEVRENVVTFFKHYWDIVVGVVAGVLIATTARFELQTVQVCYSVIILILVCIGLLRIVKQERDKRLHDERKPNVVDAIIDKQKPIKALNIAQAPTKEGENLGKQIIEIWRFMTPIMEKIKLFFSKFKGYLLTAVLFVLSVLEMCGGFINELLGGVFIVNGIEILPIVTLGCTAIVGVLSNGFTKEQREQIKVMFSKANKNDLVQIEIKKTIKSKSTELAQYNKLLTTQEHELSNLEGELEKSNNTLQAKKEMRAMTPQLATDVEVQLAATEADTCREKVNTKRAEITKTKTAIDQLTTMIGALKAQL